MHIPSHSRIRSAGSPILHLLLALTVGACVAAPERSGSGSGGNQLTRAQIEQVAASDAYEVIRRLRPQWLRSRGQISFVDPTAADPVVYIDDSRYGPLDTLRQIHTDLIQGIQFIGATDATTRFGTGHGGGVILIHTRTP